MITNGRPPRPNRRTDLIVAGHSEGLSVQDTLFLMRFAQAYDQQVTQDKYGQRQLELQWRTIGADKSAPEGHQGGTPVQMDKRGNIHKGPSGVRGKNIKQLDKDVAGTPADKRKDAEPPTKDHQRPPSPTAGISRDPDNPTAVQVSGHEMEAYERAGGVLFWRMKGSKSGWVMASGPTEKAIRDQLGPREEEQPPPTGPAPEEPREPVGGVPSLESMIADIRFWMGSGRANLEAEQEAMDRVGADSLSEFGRKLAAVDDEAKRDVWRTLKADQDAQASRREENAAEKEETLPPEGPPPAPEPEGGGRETPKGGPDEGQRRKSKHWDPAVQRLEDQAQAYAQREGVQVAWDRIDNDTWDFWAQQGLVPGQVLTRALQDGYGPDDSGKAGAGPDDRPTTPGAEPEDAGGNFKLTNDQAEPTAADNPRQSAQQAQRKLDEDYEFATASSVRNKGRDLKGSARHRANAWRSLAEAEENGTAEALTTKATLEKAEPHDYSSWTEDNPIGGLFAHLALRKFPAKPGYGTARRRALATDEDRKKDRQQFVEAWDNLKKAIGAAARNETDPIKIRDGIQKAIKAEQDRLRQKRPDAGRWDYGEDPYNNTANALAAMSKAIGSRQRNGAIRQLAHVMVAVKETLPEGANYADAMKGAALDVMESGGIGKVTGRSPAEQKARKERLRPADLYVKHATREGGRQITGVNVDNPNAVTDHLVDDLKFEGIQFGNSMSPEERATHATLATQAMMDLADMVGLDTPDMSLGGKLGLAFGARGRGGSGFIAHYEQPWEDRGPVINLTRKGGVGSLAHEWGHALDHQIGEHETYPSESHSAKYEVRDKKTGRVLSRMGGKPYVPSNREDELEVREIAQTPVRESYSKLYQSMGPFRTRLRRAIGHHLRQGTLTKGKAEYFTEGKEVFARSFERWIQRKMEKAGRGNTYLTGLTSDAWRETDGLWPTDDEVDQMAPHFEKLVETYGASEMRQALKKEGEYALAMEAALATVERYAAAEHDPRGRWVTIGADKSNPPGEQGGARVFIGRNGKIIAGPGNLKGRNIKSLDRNVAGTSRDQRKHARPPTDKPERTAQQTYEPEHDPAAIAEQAFKTRTNIWRLMREMGVRQEDRKRLGPLVAMHMERLAKEATKPSEMRRRAMEKRKLKDRRDTAGAGDSSAAGSVRHPRLPAAADDEYQDLVDEWRMHSSGGDWHSDPQVGAGSYLRPKQMAKEMLERPKKAQAMVKLAEQGTYTNGRFWVTTPEGLNRKLREMDLAAQAAKASSETAEGTVLDDDQTEAEALRIAGILKDISTQGEWHDQAAQPVAYRDSVGRWDQWPVVAMNSPEAPGRISVLSREDVETISRLHPGAKWYLPWGREGKPAVAKLDDGTIVGATLPLDPEKAAQGLQSTEEGRPVIEPHPTRRTVEDLYEPQNKFEMELGKQHSQNRKPTIDIKGTNWGDGERFQAHAQLTQDGWTLYGGPSHSRNPDLLAGPFDNKRHLTKAIEDLGTYASGSREGRPLFKPLAHAKEKAPEAPKPKAAKRKAPDAEKLTPKLRQAIAGYIGAGDQEDVSGFHDYVKDAYKQHVSQTMSHNDQWRQATGLSAQAMRGLAQRAQRYEDVAQIPAKQQATFGKLAGAIARDYPHLLTGSAPGESEAPEGNPDELLLSALKENGPRKVLDPWDEQILDAANEMIPDEQAGSGEPSHEIPSEEEIGSGGFDAPSGFGPEEEDFPEIAESDYDDEEIPFSLRAAGGAWAVIRHHLQHADEG